MEIEQKEEQFARETPTINDDRPTLQDWALITKEDALKAQYQGPCALCSQLMQVPFRPFIGGKPPTCDQCFKREKSLERLRRGGNNHHQQQHQTLYGWRETVKKDEKSGKQIYEGPCGGCEKHTEVPFRPVNAPDAKPPLCDQCYTSMCEVTNAATDGGLGGKSKPRRNTQSTSPYATQGR